MQFPLAFTIIFPCRDVFLACTEWSCSVRHTAIKKQFKPFSYLPICYKNYPKTAFAWFPNRSYLFSPAISVPSASCGSVPAELVSSLTCVASHHHGSCGRGNGFITIWNYSSLSTSLICSFSFISLLQNFIQNFLQSLASCLVCILCLVTFCASSCNATCIVSFTQNGTCFEGAQTDSTVHIIKNADAK